METTYGQSWACTIHGFHESPLPSCQKRVQKNTPRYCDSYPVARNNNIQIQSLGFALNWCHAGRRWVPGTRSPYSQWNVVHWYVSMQEMDPRRCLALPWGHPCQQNNHQESKGKSIPEAPPNPEKEGGRTALRYCRNNCQEGTHDVRYQRHHQW